MKEFCEPERPAWRQKVAQARRAIRRCERLIGEARRIVRASNRFGTERPLRAHHFQRAGTWLVRGSAELERAAGDLNLALFLLAWAPQDVARASAAMFDIADRVVDTGMKLAETSNRLSARSDFLFEAAMRGGDRRPRIVPPWRPLPPRVLIRRPDPAVVGRMQRPPPPLPDDAPRRVSRGRAPPFVRPACSDHAVSNKKGNHYV